MTGGDLTRADEPRQRGALLGLIVGACLLVVGASGTIVTVWQIAAAFRTVEGPAIAPENKARVLAAGIESAMTATAVGILVSLVGLVLTVAAGIAFVRGRREADRPPGG